MAIGDSIAQILAKVGAVTDLDDPVQAKQIKEDMVQGAAARELFMSGREIAQKVNNDLGYIIGYLPAELGNHALQLFNVSHPFFGRNIPTNNDDCLDIGQKFGKKWRDKKYTEEENKRKAEQLAKIGVVLPSIGEEVTSSDAKKILQALRAAGDPTKVAEAEAILKAKRESRAELEKARREELERLAKKAAAAAAGEPDPDEEEEDEFGFVADDEEGDLGYGFDEDGEPITKEQHEKAEAERMRKLMGDEVLPTTPHTTTLTEDSVW